MIHALAVPIILFWLAVCAALTLLIPSLEVVGQERSVSLSPKEAPSFAAMKRIGQVFNEGNSDSMAMIVLESDKPLGDDAHRYYDELIRRLRADHKHVLSVQDFWGDPLTAAGAQSNDGKAAYVQVTLGGNQGEPLANESVETVRKIVAQMPTPVGLKTYVTGPSALVADMHHSGDKSMIRITVTTVAVIFAMLLLVYRSIITVVLLLLTVGLELTAARGVVALLGHSGAIGLSTFAVSLLTSLAIAAGTDYGIFIIGRYQEARQAGEDRETAFYTMYRGVAHVILGSGSDHRRGDFLPQLRPDALLLHVGDPLRGGDAGRRRGRDDAGPGNSGRRQPVRPVRPQAAAQSSRLATRRHHGGALAAADPRRHLGRRPGWPARAARIQDQLQRPGLSTEFHTRQRGLRGRGSPFLPGQNEARDIDDRVGSRYAQSGGLSGFGQTRQGHLPCSRHFPGPGDNQARRNGDGPHVDTVPNQHAERRSSADHEVPARPDEQHAQAGRGDGEDRRADAADVRPDVAARRHDPPDVPGHPGDAGDHE